MGLITLLDLRAEVANDLQRSGLENSNPTRIDRWINNALREVAYAFKFREFEAVVSFNTVDGKSAYIIGTDIVAAPFRALHELGLFKKSPTERVGKLIPEDRNTWLKKVNLLDSTARGDPRYYHKYGNIVYVRPVADSTVVAIDFHFWKSVAALSAPTSTSPLHEDWDEVLQLGALYRGHRALGEHDRYVNVRNDFLGMVRSRVMEQGLEEFPEGGISLAQSEDDLVRE